MNHSVVYTLKLAGVVGGVLGACGGVIYNLCRRASRASRESLYPPSVVADTRHPAWVLREGVVSFAAETTYRSVEEQVTLFGDITIGAAVGAVCLATAPLSYPAYLIFRHRQSSAAATAAIAGENL